MAAAAGAAAAADLAAPHCEPAAPTPAGTRKRKSHSKGSVRKKRLRSAKRAKKHQEKLQKKQHKAMAAELRAGRASTQVGLVAAPSQHTGAAPGASAPPTPAPGPSGLAMASSLLSPQQAQGSINRDGSSATEAHESVSQAILKACGYGGGQPASS